MTASDQYTQTLSTLVATRATMLSPEWQANLAGQSPALRLQASQQLVQVQQAISALSNAALTDIVTQMNAQQAALQNATTALNTTLKDITKVQDIVNAVTSVISTVVKIVPLV